MADKSDQSKPDDDKVAGYVPSDLVKAPVKPPQPDTSETPEITNNPAVRYLFILGILLAVTGVLLLFTIVWLGIIVLGIGTGLIVYGVFVPVKE